MTLLKLRLPVVSLAVPLPIAKDAAPRREMPESGVATPEEPQVNGMFSEMIIFAVGAIVTLVDAADVEILTLPAEPPV
jgi:hypothetical protein